MTGPIFRNPPWVASAPMTAAQAAGQTMPWGHEFLHIPEAWAHSKGKGVRVAVLDTGVDHHHPDINGSLLAVEDETGQGPMDRNSHGTWCVGMICGENNDEGIVGIAPECQVVSVKVLGDDGSGYGQWIAAGIHEADKHGCSIISMSLGSYREDPTISGAIRTFLGKGPNRAVIAAAGNDGWRDPRGINWPGAMEETQAVAAINKQGEMAPFSSRGPGVTVAAPGVEILSTVPGGLYQKMSGTSMATPIVAGVVALMQGAGIEWKTPADLTAILKASAVDIGEPGEDIESGAGIIDPTKLLVPGEAPGEPIQDGTTRFKLFGMEIAYPLQTADGKEWIGVRGD